jgi:membrane fusion protein (multidrug efflux system)
VKHVSKAIDVSRLRQSGAAMLCALLTAAWCPGCDRTKQPANATPPAPVVYVSSVARRDVPLYLETVGTLDGYVNADIRARVRGYLERQSYDDGAFVKTNQLLFSIEQGEYATAVAAARASLARARAALQRNEALQQRSQALFKSGAVSQQDLDNAIAGAADAAAQVQAADAELKQASLNLSYTQIRSPITGVAGVALVRMGNLVGQDGPTLLTTVSQVDPIRVSFPISERDYVQYPEAYKHWARRDLAWARKQFSKLAAGGAADDGDPGIALVLADGSVYRYRGLIVSADRQISASTGTIQLQALIPNPDGVLRPGQYGRVRIRRGQEGQHALIVPEKALLSLQGTYSVAVLGPGNKVQLRRVTLGPSVQGERIVEQGLSEGDRIVVEGVQKLSDGAVVDPKPAPPAPSQVTSAALGSTAGKSDTAKQ